MLSTKANTLDALSKRVTKSRVNRLVFFTHAEWVDQPYRCLEKIQSHLVGKVAVRSSAIDEDTLLSSNAGAFHSELDVCSYDALQLNAAIEKVIASYGAKESANPLNQVLVQEQSNGIVASGVCTTRTLDNAPYYVIAYVEGTDTSAVTSGSKSQIVRILRGSNRVPKEFQGLIAAVQELEALLKEGPLDIEFGITQSGEILLFQVRSLVLPHSTEKQDAALEARVSQLQEAFSMLAQPQVGLAGQTTFLADMTDWNPAEMIGDRATNLAFSLYDHLITGQIWAQARASQGYYDVTGRALVHLIGNKPYVDVRRCFNSFLPSDLPTLLREKLLAYYLAKLQTDPSLQDKAEFEILFTCYDASFSKRSRELLASGFEPAEVEQLKTSLLRLTNALMDVDSLRADLEKTRQIDGLIEPFLQNETVQERLTRAARYLELCKQYGTLPFARLARLGFVSAAILKGFVPEVLSQEQYEEFYLSVNTVARDLQLDTERLALDRISAETFLKRYGHLRPGTYDITSLRYDEQDLRLSAKSAGREVRSQLPPQVSRAMWNALREHGLKGSVLELFTFARLAMEAREEAKFHFTKLLSEVLKIIADCGAQLGFSRESLSLLCVQDVLMGIGKSDQEVKKQWADCIDRGREIQKVDSLLDLPPILFSSDDLEIVIPFVSRPTFITQKSVTTEVVFLREGSSRSSVTGKIAVLERGDPGYDWIFAQEPAGLVTKYGGAGSHMAIRCNEFSLPAAIGCGEDLFRLALRGGPMTLDCGAKVLRSAHATL